MSIVILSQFYVEKLSKKGGNVTDIQKCDVILVMHNYLPWYSKGTLTMNATYQYLLYGTTRISYNHIVDFSLSSSVEYFAQPVFTEQIVADSLQCLTDFEKRRVRL